MLNLLRFTVPVFIIGAAAFWWAGRRVTAHVRRARWIKFATYVVIVHAVLLVTVAGRWATSALVALIVVLGLWELFRLAPRLRATVATTALTVYVGIAAGAVWLTIEIDAAFVGYL